MNYKHQEEGEKRQMGSNLGINTHLLLLCYNAEAHNNICILKL